MNNTNNSKNSKNDLYDYISKYPIISRSKERWEFAKKVERRNVDLIVNSNLRSVYKIANMVIKTSYNLDDSDFFDLFNSGVLGLYRAIEKFDAKYDIRFASYSYYWIKGYMLKERNKKRIIRRNKHSKWDMDNLDNIISVDYLENFDENKENKGKDSLCLTECIRKAYEQPQIAPIERVLDRNDVMGSIIELLVSKGKEDYEEVFVLTFYDGYSAKEVADRMGLTRRQIQWKLEMIHRIIKEEYGSDWGHLKGLLKGAI